MCIEDGIDLFCLFTPKYSRLHIRSDEIFFKIMKKPSIVQKEMIPHMNGLLVFIEIKQKKKIVEKKIKLADSK